MGLDEWKSDKEMEGMIIQSVTALCCNLHSIIHWNN